MRMTTPEFATVIAAAGVPTFLIGLLLALPPLSALGTIVLGAAVAADRRTMNANRPGWPLWKLVVVAIAISVVSLFVLEGYAESGIAPWDAAASILFALIVCYFAMYWLAFRCSRYYPTALSGIAIFAALFCGIGAFYFGAISIEQKHLGPEDFPFDQQTAGFLFLGSLSLGFSMAVHPVQSWARRREAVNTP